MILGSQDGYDWHTVGTSTASSSGIVGFETDELALFALVDTPELPICTITVEDDTVANGSTVSLNWTSIGADTLTGSGFSTPTLSGQTSVTPGMDQSSIYSIQATNIAGSSICSVTVQTGPVPACTIEASPSSVKNGTTTTLTWTGSNVVSSRLNPGNIMIPQVGNMDVTPESSSTTDYSITMNNDF